jgi:hypothetical protein
MSPERMAMTPAEAGVEEPAPSEWTPPEWTAEEVRRITILRSFDTKAALDGLDALAEQVPALELAVSQAKLDLQFSEEKADLREGELRAGVEGKNEQERKDNLAKARQADETYQAYAAEVREGKAKLNETEREAQVARHRERYWHAVLTVRSAQIAYLAGG